MKIIPKGRGNRPQQRSADPRLGNLSLADRRFAEVLARAAESGMAQQNVIRGLDPARFDSDSINLTIDFRARLATIYRDKFQSLRALDFVPMLDAPIQQTSTGYLGEFLSRIGTAQLITEVSTDVPLVQVVGRTFSGKVATYGAAGAWSQMDVFRASVGLVSLPIETQKAARESVETMTDVLVSLGNADAGVPGFLRHPEVDSVPFTLGNWTTRTFDQVLADIHSWVQAIMLRVGYVESSLPDTIIFAPLAKAALMNVRNAFGVTAWKVINEELKESYGITVDSWSRCATANDSGGARIVAYRRDPKCIGAIVPMMYTEFAPQERGFQVLIPAMASCGGTVVIETRTVTYADNALS